MTLGTLHKGANAIFFKRPIELIFEVVVQIVMLMALFGFMDFLIIKKWLTDWDTMQASGEISSAPPGIVETMVVMFMDLGKQDGKHIVFIGEQSKPETQQYIMATCVILALLAIPLMLFVRPCYDSRKHKSVDDQ